MVDDFDVVTKLTHKNCSFETFEASLAKLKTQSVYGVLLHDGHKYDAQVDAVFSELRSQKKAKKIGASFYDKDSLLRVIDHFEIDLVQVPISVMDRRLVEGGFLTELKQRGIEIHVRSVFLQGLLFMSPKDLPEFVKPLRPWVESFHDLAQKKSLDVYDICLGFVKALSEVDYIICGVHNVQQLRSMIQAYQKDMDVSWVSDLPIPDQQFLNPVFWK